MSLSTPYCTEDAPWCNYWEAVQDLDETTANEFLATLWNALDMSTCWTLACELEDQIARQLEQP